MNNNRSKSISNVLYEFAVLKHAMMKQAASCKPYFPPTQKEVLFILKNNDDISLKKLASIMDITPGATTQLTDALVGSGYLIREIDKSDRRVIKVKLSDKGKELIKKLSKSRIELYTKLMDGLSDNEIENFHKIIKKMTSNLTLENQKRSNNE